MIHSKHAPTETIADRDGTQRHSLSRVFSSGNSLSREAFDSLWRATDLRGVDFFKMLMQSTVELEVERASLVASMSRSAPSAAALRHHWLQSHALGHLALLSFRDNVGWFASMLENVTVRQWTPTFGAVRQRIMSVALRAAWAAGQIGETALGLYLAVLSSAAEPLQHFDAVLAVAMVCLRNRDLAPLARPSLEQWASRANSADQYRRELLNSVAFLLDDPDGARIWSASWSRRVLSLRGNRYHKRLVAEGLRLGISGDELLFLAALNDVGDCAIFLGDLSPAVTLLAHLQDRNPDQFYAPTSIVPILAQAWTPQLSSEVLDRTVSSPNQNRAFDA